MQMIRLLPLLLLVLAVGCDDDAANGETPTTASTTATESTTDQVTVASAGSRFEPAVTTDQIPHGAWMCDMNGSVHYAALERGDGECPVCGMDLVQHGAEHGHSMGNHENHHENHENHENHGMGSH